MQTNTDEAFQELKPTLNDTVSSEKALSVLVCIF